MRVVVLSGGRSSEHEVSLRSGAAVAEGLGAAGHEVVAVRIERDGRWTLDGEPIDVAFGAGLLGADVAFPVLHGPYGEDGTVQGALECLDVAYVGPGVLAAAVCIDKLTFKRLLAFHAIPQVDFCRRRGGRLARAGLALGPRCGSSRRGSARASGSRRSPIRSATSTPPSRRRGATTRA